MNMDKAIKDRFDKLCNDSYLNQSLSGYGYQAFLSILDNRITGRFATEEEIGRDFSALEIAQMLKQIYKAEEFTLVVEDARIKYRNSSLVAIISDSLIKELQKRISKSPHSVAKRGNDIVEDYGAVMYLNKFAGNDGRVTRIPYPEGVTPYLEDGFSIEEIDEIIRFEKMQETISRKYLGNKTRSPELGHLCEILLPFLPEEWILEDKCYFLYGFLVLAGFLDFRGEKWISAQESTKWKNDKAHQVKDWIKAYHKHRKK